MSNVRISQLSPTTEVQSEDFVPVVDSASLTTYRASVQTFGNWLAGSGSSLSSSWASSSVSSDSASWASSSVSSSFSDKSFTSDTSSFVTGIPDFSSAAGSASWASHSVSSDSASWASHSLTSVSSSWSSQSLSSSWALFAVSSSQSLSSNFSTSSSFSSTSLTASLAATASSIRSDRLFSLVTTSSTVSLSYGTLIISSAQHHLGTVPKLIQVFLINKAANGSHGYSVGDIVPMESIIQSNNDGTTHPAKLLSVWANSTFYSLGCNHGGSGWAIMKKNGSAVIFTTEAQVLSDWNARVVLAA